MSFIPKEGEKNTHMVDMKQFWLAAHMYTIGLQQFDSDTLLPLPQGKDTTLHDSTDWDCGPFILYHALLNLGMFNFPVHHVLNLMKGNGADDDGAGTKEYELSLTHLGLEFQSVSLHTIPDIAAYVNHGWVFIAYIMQGSVVRSPYHGSYEGDGHFVLVPLGGVNNKHDQVLTLDTGLRDHAHGKNTYIPIVLHKEGWNRAKYAYDLGKITKDETAVYPGATWCVGSGYVVRLKDPAHTLYRVN